MKTIWTQAIFTVLLLAAASLLTASAAEQAVGRITAASGVTSIQHANAAAQVSGNTAIYKGDAIVSGERGFMQLRMQNGAYVVLFPHSTLALVGGDAGNGFSYQLHEGMVHIITDNATQLASSIGTVKTQGADFANMECAGNCYHTSGELYPDGLYVWVKSGSASITANGSTTASLASTPVRLAYVAGTSVAYHPQVSDVGRLRLVAAGGSGVSASGGAVAFVAAGGGAPALLPSVPDFFISASFKSQMQFDQPKRVEAGIGVQVTQPGGGGGGIVVPTSPN